MHLLAIIGPKVTSNVWKTSKPWITVSENMTCHRVKKDAIVGSVKISMACQKLVDVIAAEDLTVLVAKAENQLRKEILLKQDAKAPIIKGDIGTLKVYDNDTYLGETVIEAKDDVKKQIFTIMIRKIRNFFVG